MEKILILALGLLACNQRNASVNLRNNATANKEVVNPKVIEVQTRDTVASYDTTVYRRYIPQTVIRLMREKLAEWHLLTPSDWDKFRFKEYKTENSLVNYITADFN